MEGYIPIAISFTPNYFIPAVTLIKSILDSSDTQYSYHIYCFLTEELDNDMKSDFIQLDSRLKLSFINLSGKLQGIYINERYTAAASYRLLLPELIEEHAKIIYIDCDIIVRQDLGKLFNKFDLSDNYFAGVFEANIPEQLTYLNGIGCTPGQYINSGFLIMNLEKLREDKMVGKLLETSNNSALDFPDQDAINIVCKGKIAGLPPVYNSIRTYFLPQYKNDFLKYYTENDWRDVQECGNIHYTGEKPWNAYTVEFEQWWRGYVKLPIFIKRKYSFEKDRKVYYLYRLLRYSIFKLTFKFSQQLYRRIKHS